MRQLEETSPAWTSIALAPLKFIERLTLWADYINVANRHKEDLWWIRFSDGTEQGPVPFRSVIEALLAGASRVSLIHASQKEDEGAEWLELNQPMLWRHPLFSRLWTVAFWAIISCALVCLVGVLAPSWKFESQVVTTCALTAFWGWHLFRRLTSSEGSDTGHASGE